MTCGKAIGAHIRIAPTSTTRPMILGVLCMMLVPSLPSRPNFSSFVHWQSQLFCKKSGIDKFCNFSISLFNNKRFIDQQHSNRCGIEYRLHVFLLPFSSKHSVSLFVVLRFSLPGLFADIAFLQSIALTVAFF